MIKEVYVKNNIYQHILVLKTNRKKRNHYKLHDKDSIDYFFYIVDKMKNDSEHWDVPPLIVNYCDGRFEVNDGRHRLEMYRQLNTKVVDAVLWVTGDEDYKKLLGVLAC